ncbi:MAG TPA: chemotaxis protein CheB, partial [Opitutaceae bacterium]
MGPRSKVTPKTKPAPRGSAPAAASRRPKRDAAAAAPGEVFVVGVGASAGGLQALQTFFGALTDSLNAAFVVVQHLSPDFKSFMVELLAKHTRMPVQRAEQGVAVRPGNIYLIPPKVTLTISRGRLQLAKSDPRRGLHLPIDQFFASLAR